MFLKNLELVNFRSFPKLSLSFPNTLLIHGENSKGKSTVLEAIYFLATTKSIKAEKDSQLIRFGESYALLRAQVEDGASKTQLSITVQKRTNPTVYDRTQGQDKRLKVNEIAKRAVDYIGNLVAVLFSPEDINLVTGSPSLRRWHLDLTLAQVDREYKAALTVYFAALLSRNKILKKIKGGVARVDELEFWTGQMITAGSIIQKKRSDLFEFLNQQDFLATFGQLKLNYLSNIISEQRESQLLSREIAAASSLIGPHRDDFNFELNSQDLASFGSRGQQRTAVLDLKLAELKFVQQVKGSTPILLLDDVFSELDKKHRDYVASAALGQQTIITAVETSNVPQDFLSRVQQLPVEALSSD